VRGVPLLCWLALQLEAVIMFCVVMLLYSTCTINGSVISAGMASEALLQLVQASSGVAVPTFGWSALRALLGCNGVE
jgi:hypothetical protein